MASRWPSHNEIRGEKSGHEIKVSSSGSHISGAARRQVPQFVWGQFILFPLLISLGLGSCYTSSGTCLESAAPCHALAVPSALTPADTAHLTLFHSVNFGFQQISSLNSLILLFVYQNCTWQFLHYWFVNFVLQVKIPGVINATDNYSIIASEGIFWWVYNPGT